MTSRQRGPARFATERRPSERRAITAALVVLPLGLFGVLAAAVATGTVGWDNSTVRFAHRYYKPSIGGPLEEALKVSIAVGAAISIGAVIALLACKRRVDALFWALAVGGVLGIELALKELFGRPPLGEQGGGFRFRAGTRWPRLPSSPRSWSLFVRDGAESRSYQVCRS
jgi:hypothetical protein